MANTYLGYTLTAANAALDSIWSYLTGTAALPTGRQGPTLKAYLTNNAVVNIDDFGALHDGVQYDDAAWTAAFNALPANGGVLRMPSAKYRFATTKTWSTKPVIVRGSGDAIQPNMGTTVQFDPGQSGFIMQNGALGLGANSAVEDLCILNTDAVLGTNDGIRIQCTKGRARRVMVQGFGRHGIYVLSALVVSDNTINANNFEIDHCRAYLCKGSGYKADGVDSNAGHTLLFDGSSCGQWGMYDNSFLGNTHIAPHVAGNISGGYRIGNASRSNRIIGGYKEQDGLVGVQLDVGGGEGNILDFLQMVDTVVDNTATKDNFIFWQSAGLHASKLAIGNGTTTDVLLKHQLLILQNGAMQQFANPPASATPANWFASVLGDGRLNFTSAQGKAVNFGNPVQSTGDLSVLGAGFGLQVTEGANAKMGSANLGAGGTVTISTTKVHPASRILLTTQAAAGTPGALYVGARVDGVSFVIQSTNAADTSAVMWMIVDPL